MATNKRIRGIAIHRSILIGSTATPLSEVERITSPPDHTHRWTVAVRSASSHPLPTVADSEASTSSSAVAPRDAIATPAPGPQTTPAPTSGVSTRGREHETDYHKMVGGKDDISHFIKRVQFKLHETYPQSTRSIDKAPFQVTETGWGEFDIQIKIIFVAESGEKPLTTYHRLKLHPWHPISMRAAGIETAPLEIAATSLPTEENAATEGRAADVHESAAAEDTLDTSMELDSRDDAERPMLRNDTEVQGQQAMEANLGSSSLNFPPVVHSWSYDEIVFPEPTEAFYEILIANPPTPLPAQSAQAFADSTAFTKYKESLGQMNESSGPQGRDLNRESGIKPPHPLHNSSGALFDALSQEAIQSEAERFDKARYNAVHQLEDTRQQLIEGERKLREGRIGQSRAITS